MNPTDLTYQLLEEITDGFSEERKLGKGRFGAVYKGKHKNGDEIAAKILHDDSQGFDDEKFDNEFENLMRFKHPNIIDEFHGLDWPIRYNIIKGTCEGLNYLHEELKPPIYHMDLKPDNILLHMNMVPKLADFGLSKIFSDGRTRITQTVVGTLGYMPREYLEKKQLSNKLDIFSLGAVLENWKTRIQTRRNGSLLEAYCQQVKTCTEIALKCLETDKEKRPIIVEIINQIKEKEAIIGEIKIRNFD
uniref:non-specific serine/threonine protein kinase n=1 Tax=Oryza coarctata TaxID=77588 RepID=E0CW92_ORYCO|nr:protein kinase-1 [Oryza coarctata]